MSHTAPRVFKVDGDSLFPATRFNREITPVLVQHRAFAVLCQIQEHLKQALPVRPDKRYGRIDFDGKVDFLVVE